MTTAHRLLVGLALLAPALSAVAQWRPTGALAAVPVIRDCRETGGDVAVARFQPSTIYLCPALMSIIRKANPGAEEFYVVHEYGHVALQTADESLADCWAAKALAGMRSPRGAHILAAAIAHFRQRPNEYRAGYGTPSQRADGIRQCADEALRDSASSTAPSSPAPARPGA